MFNRQVKYSDIAGYEDLKDEVRAVVEVPLTKSAEYRRMGLTPARGILLYGPPGCSKTLTAKAIAHESSHNFIAIKVQTNFICTEHGQHYFVIFRRHQMDKSVYFV